MDHRDDLNLIFFSECVYLWKDVSEPDVPSVYPVLTEIFPTALDYICNAR